MPIDRTNWFVKPPKNNVSVDATANSAEAKHREAVNAPQAGENAAPLLATLQSAKNTLSRLLAATEKQIRLIEGEQNPEADAILPPNFISSFASSVVSLQTFVYRYSRANWTCLLDLLSNSDETRLDVGIQVTPKCIFLFLPYLPPKKQTARDPITDQLYAALCRHSVLPNWQRYHIAFTHIYHPSCPARDVDNYNYKPAIDAIAFALSKPDGPNFCSLSMSGLASNSLIPGVYVCVSENDPKSSDFSVFEKMQNIATYQNANTDF